MAVDCDSECPFEGGWRDGDGPSCQGLNEPLLLPLLEGSSAACEVEPNTLNIIINNSPCERCAEGLRELQAHSLVDFINFQAANAYQGGAPVEMLEGSGVTVDWYSVEAHLAQEGISLEDDVLATFPRLRGNVEMQREMLAARRRKDDRTRDAFG